MLWAYFDDSGTHPGSPYTVLGGLVGDESQWAEFNARWRDLLSCPLPGKPPLSKWHSTACKARDGEFRTYTEAERDSVTYEFRQVITDCDLVTFAVSVERPAWDEIMTGALSEFFGGAGDCAFMACLDFCVACTKYLIQENSIRAVFDSGWMTSLFDERADAYRALASIDSISGDTVENALGLQGADMIATETYWYTQEWIKPDAMQRIRAHFRPFERGDLSRGIIFRREEILKMSNLFRVTSSDGAP